MASNPTPAGFFGAGYSFNSDAITMNTSDHVTPLLAEVTSAEANGTTGDYRKIVYGFMEMLYDKFSNVTPVPSKIKVNRSSYEDTNTGELVRTYSVTCRTVATGIEINDEP